jgi:HAE1 family hydrophobic/amphiphilic exporter-1
MALALASAAPSPAGATPNPASSPVPVATTTPFANTDENAYPSPFPSVVLPPVPVSPDHAPSGDTLPPADIAGVDQPFVGISLDDAVAMALSRNTDLALSQSNRRIAGYQIVAAKGAYDVKFMVQPSYSVDRQAAISPLQSGPGGGPITQITAGASGGFSGNTVDGGSYSIFSSAQRINNNFVYNGYDPYYETSLGFSFTQPLARNLGLDDRRRQLEIAFIAHDLSNDNALLQASNTLDSVLDAYDDLVAAWTNVAISEDALREAKAQEQSNARLVRHGAAAPVDIAESDTQVAEFQDDVYSAIANVSSLQNQLKQLLLANPADPLWTANLVPTSPARTFAGEPAIDKIVTSALAHRPEVAQLRENIREEDVNVAYEKNQTKPQVDLNLGVTENGFAGAPDNDENTPLFSVIGSEINDINALIARSNAAGGGTPLMPIDAAALNATPYTGTIGKIGESFGTALRGEFPEYTISATLSFPLRNRAAEGNYRSELERRRALQTQEVALIERVQYEARNAVQNYRSARSRIVAATAERRNAEIVAASELRKFHAGASTTFLVLQREVELANARKSELQAQNDLERATIELSRVDGTILTSNNVDVGTLGTGLQGAVPDLVASPASPSPAPK